MSEDRLTRSEMQAEAVAIQQLAIAALAVLDTKHGDHAFDLCDLISFRAKRLNIALDSINCEGEPK